METSRTPGEFARRIDLYVDRVLKNSSKMVRAAAVAIDAAIVTSSPKDTGRFQSNWIASIEVPDHSTRPPYAPAKDGQDGGANARAAMDHARSVIGTRRAGQAIYLQNSLPYAGALNDGHSKQAPAGMVERGVRAGEQVVRRSKLLNPTGGGGGV